MGLTDFQWCWTGPCGLMWPWTHSGCFEGWGSWGKEMRIWKKQSIGIWWWFGLDILLPMCHIVLIFTSKQAINNGGKKFTSMICFQHRGVWLNMQHFDYQGLLGLSGFLLDQYLNLAIYSWMMVVAGFISQPTLGTWNVLWKKSLINHFFHCSHNLCTMVTGASLWKKTIGIDVSLK